MTDAPSRAPLALIRLSLSLEMIALLAVLAVVGLLAAFVPAAFGDPPPYAPTERAAARKAHEQDVKAWAARRGYSQDTTGRPAEPRPLVATGPDRREAVVTGVAGHRLILMLPLVPSLLLAASGLVSAVGRFGLARAAISSGASAVFAGAGLLAVGRFLGGLAAVGLFSHLAVGFDGIAATERALATVVGGGCGALLFALYCGMTGEALGVSGLALIAGQAGEGHRRRIGAAAAFYPCLLLGTFWVGAILFGLSAAGADLPVAFLSGGGLVATAAVHAIHAALVSRAYRFPSAEVRVN